MIVMIVEKFIKLIVAVLELQIVVLVLVVVIMELWVMFLMYRSGCFVAGGANEDDNDRIDNEIDGKNDA